MRIAIGSDHGGFNLKAEIKNLLTELQIDFHDVGTHSGEAVDYPEIAELVGKAVISGECTQGILICGTGIGISIAANKMKGIRAALCHDVFSAQMSREHNNANILTMGERVIGESLALDIVDIFLETEFEGGRHQQRIDKITSLETK